MKTKEEILEWLRKVETDERLHYESANVFINAPLTLIQTELETKSNVFREILGMPLCHHGPNGKWTPINKKGG